MVEQTQESIDEWKKSITQYKESKTQLQWHTNPPVSYITEKMKKEIEMEYKPISQKYTDNSKEKIMEEKEQANLIKTLAKNKVVNFII